MNAQRSLKHKMHKCLAAKLYLLADSFQASIRLTSSFIHIKQSSGKTRLLFQTQLCCYTKASCPFRHCNTVRATSPFSEEFLSFLTSPVHPEALFLSFSLAAPSSPLPAAAPIRSRWFPFLSRRLSEKLHLPQSPKLCRSESKRLR